MIRNIIGIYDFPEGTPKPFSFPRNHLLSKKLLSFEQYPLHNAYCEDIEKRIAKEIYGYTDSQPIYNNNIFSSSNIDAFMRSDKFAILMVEFTKCFELIVDWVIENKVKLKTSKKGCYFLNSSKESSYFIANFIKLSFLKRLQDNLSPDLKGDLYNGGKKNIETIAVLIREESISLEFRKETIALLLDPETFTLCSGACLSSLADAAGKLNNYDRFSPVGLIKSLVTILAEEVAISNVVPELISFSTMLCMYANTCTDDFEIHAVNYLRERLKWDLRADFLALASDPYLYDFKLRLNRGTESEHVPYVKYVREFERRFNATNLVKFIVSQLYDACSIYRDNYSSLQNFIDNRLNKLGKDPEFNWGEIFTEDGDLKEADYMDITIAERLINSGWLEIPRQQANNFLWNIFNKINFFATNNTLSKIKFKIYPNNIALSWVKKEEHRQTILEVLTEEGGYEWLNNNIFHDYKNLLQNIKDFVLFFRHLPLLHHLSVLEKLESTGFDIPLVLKDTFDNAIDFIDFYNLFSRLSHPGKKFFVTKYPMLLHSILNSILQRVRQIRYEQVFCMINQFIGKLIKAGYKDFSNLQFLKRNTDYDIREHESYLNNIDFSNTNLKNVKFYENISRCKFKNTNLQGVMFIDTQIIRSDFSKAEFAYCTFDKVLSTSNTFINANLENTEIKNSCLIENNFHYAKLQNVNIINTNILSSCFTDGKISEVKFLNLDLISVFFTNAQLDKVDFIVVAIGVDFSNSSLNKVNFVNSEFVCVSIEKAYMIEVNVSHALLKYFYHQGVRDFSKLKLTGNSLTKLINPANPIKIFIDKMAKHKPENVSKEVAPIIVNATTEALRYIHTLLKKNELEFERAKLEIYKNENSIDILCNRPNSSSNQSNQCAFFLEERRSREILSKSAVTQSYSDLRSLSQ